jgi:glycosyltransferase involved in cell wall biosynthesis
MRILHVTDCYLPRLGGIETHVQDLVTQQRGEGHDARVLTLTPADPHALADPDWVTRVGYARVPVAGSRAGREVDALLGDADAVHAHVSVVSPFAFGAARRAAARQVPTLVTVHSLWSYTRVLPLLAGAAVGLSSWPVQWSAVSEAAADPVRRVLGAATPVLVLPNAVDPGRWTSVHREPEVPTIFSVGRFTWTKRPMALARMLREVRARLPEETALRAVLIGDGPQRAPVERYLERHGMRDWVELPGRLSRDAIHEAYAQASLYVAPAERESFGIAALEARCAGIPVVASSRGGVGSFITSGVHGILADDDDAMVAAMVELVSDPAAAAVLEANNRVAPVELDWPAASARALDGYARAARIAAGASPARQLVGRGR